MNTVDQAQAAVGVSAAWVQAMSALADRTGRSGFHLVMRITDPAREDVGIRGAVEALLTDLDLPGVETVAGTIFPRDIARTSRDPSHLAQRYRSMLPLLKKLGSPLGTYFGRVVDHPNHGDQLEQLVRKLRASVIDGPRMKSTYEMDLLASWPVGVYDGTKDSKVRQGFPCLSHLSFHLDSDHLHLAANYRSQYMVQRGYGNYLGLARLLEYVADQVGVATGELLVVSGRVEIDGAWTRVRPRYEQASAEMERDLGT